MNAPLALRGGNTKPIEHGGKLAGAKLLYPNAPLPWVDLSTGIHPVAWPVPHLSAKVWQRLPELADVFRLENVAAQAYRVDDARQVVAAPGTQALIQWIATLFPGPSIGILGFTYGEYAHVWAQNGAVVEIVTDAAKLKGYDVAVVVNPNNPDGRLLDYAVLARIRAENALLLVDEAFMDFMPSSYSSAPALNLGAENLIVLRSFGKTYGLAGLRLGFALAAVPIANALRGKLGPWAVSGPAVEIGAMALADRDWLNRTRVVCETQSLKLDRLLESAGFEIIGGTPLFRLAANDSAGEWHTKLAHAGILSRAFLERPLWLRFGLPADAAAWNRLQQGMLSLLS